MLNKVSIIVPVYNVEMYVGRCLNSLVSQSYSNIEIIIVDDGSLDSSKKICEEYSSNDPRIKVIEQENQGLSGARNTAMRYVTGEFVAFVDSDDYVEKRYIEELYSAMVNSNADIAVCAFYNQFSDKTVTFRMKEQVLDSISATRFLVQDNVMPSYVWNKMYKRNLWDNIVFPVGKKFEDIYVMHKVFMKAGTISVIDKPLYHYIRRQDSITGVSKLTNTADTFDALKSRRNDLLNTEYYHVSCLTEMQKMRASLCEINNVGKNGEQDCLSTRLDNELRQLYKEEKQYLSFIDRMKFEVFFSFPILYSKYYGVKH